MQNSLYHLTSSFGGWRPPSPRLRRTSRCSPLTSPGYTSGFHNFFATFVEILPGRLGPEAIVGRHTRPDHLKCLNASLLGRSTPISPIPPISPSLKCLNGSFLGRSAISRPLYDHDLMPVTLTQPHRPAAIVNVKANPPRAASGVRRQSEASRRVGLSTACHIGERQPLPEPKRCRASLANLCDLGLRISDFGSRTSLGFRPSDFGFISPRWGSTDFVAGPGFTRPSTLDPRPSSKLNVCLSERV